MKAFIFILFIIFVTATTWQVNEYLLDNTTCTTDTECDEYWRHQ